VTVAAGPIVHVVGARPNFMKAGPVIRALDALGAGQALVHTGQHYDRTLSDVFFEDLGLPEPALNLEVGSGTHGRQTAALLIALEDALPKFAPSIVVVYGDVNSTLAGALVATKLGLRLAHVEAGLRSFDRTMAEEINRVVTDALADVLLVTSPEAVDNLRREGVAAERVRFVGNPMIDTLLANLGRFDAAAARQEHGLEGPFAVATIHRPSNVDDEAAAAGVVDMLRGVTAQLPVVLPLHPRGRENLSSAGLLDIPSLRVIEPLGYVPFLSLVRGAAVVITDSGGIQEETTVLGIPCLTVRPNTERPITISHGTNRLVRPEEVPGAVRAVLAGRVAAPRQAPPLWDGHAGERIARILVDRQAIGDSVS
jgi:UDP-N-acetylglucosamine 2-epimerase (non-hydrolysing)